MRCRNILFLSSLALSSVFVSSAAWADNAKDYNLFVLGNMTVPSGDTEGRVAVGHDATLGAGYSVGNSASAADTNFVVGHDLIASSGSAKGATVVGGTASPSVGPANSFTTNLLPSGTPLPVEITAEAAWLQARALELGGFADTGSVGTVQWGGQFTINAAPTGLSVFSMTAADLATSNTFSINIDPAATLLINVSGSAASFTGGLFLNGVNGNGNASSILWNFYEATTLNIQYTSFLGTVLAPFADFSSGGGQAHGTMIVNNYSGLLEMHADSPYTGGLLTPPETPAVPEPASWAMMIGGFGALGAVMRRKWRLVLA